MDTKGRDVDSIEGWTNGEEIYPLGPPRTPSHSKRHTRNLLFVEAERTKRRPENVNGPIPDRQGMSISCPVGLRMGRRQREHWNAPSLKTRLNESEPAPVGANQIRKRHGVLDVRRTHQSVHVSCSTRLRKT